MRVEDKRRKERRGLLVVRYRYQIYNIVIGITAILPNAIIFTARVFELVLGLKVPTPAILNLLV